MSLLKTGQPLTWTIRFSLQERLKDTMTIILMLVVYYKTFDTNRTRLTFHEENIDFKEELLTSFSQIFIPSTIKGSPNYVIVI